MLNRKATATLGSVSVTDVVDDLIALQRLADDEPDPARRQTLDEVRSHLVAREPGMKVADAARVLGLTPPTVRAWLQSGVLDDVQGTSPVRVDMRSLAEVKHTVDLLREHGHDRNLLVAVMRILRDRAALDGDGVAEGFEDLAAGGLVPLTDDLLAELAATKRTKRSRSASS